MIFGSLNTKIVRLYITNIFKKTVALIYHVHSSCLVLGFLLANVAIPLKAAISYCRSALKYTRVSSELLIRATNKVLGIHYNVFVTIPKKRINQHC